MAQDWSCPVAEMTAVARRVAESAQQAHHIVVVLRRRQATAGYPIEQFNVCAVEQSFEAVELRGIEPAEGVFGERAKKEIGLLRPTMPAAEQEPLTAEVRGVGRPVARCNASSTVSHIASPIVNDGKMMWNDTVNANCSRDRRSAVRSIGF